MLTYERPAVDETIPAPEAPRTRADRRLIGGLVSAAIAGTVIGLVAVTGYGASDPDPEPVTTELGPAAVDEQVDPSTTATTVPVTTTTTPPPDPQQAGNLTAAPGPEVETPAAPQIERPPAPAPSPAPAVPAPAPPAAAPEQAPEPAPTSPTSLPVGSTTTIPQPVTG